jgi:hypothetical protein
MRYLTLALVIAGVVGVSRVSAQSKVEQELVQVENDWCAADIKQDSAMLARILADDFTSVGSRGTLDTKASTLATYKDKSSLTTACTNTNMKVRV